MTTKILPHSDICEDADTSSEQGKGHRTSAPLEDLATAISWWEGVPYAPNSGPSGFISSLLLYSGNPHIPIGKSAPLGTLIPCSLTSDPEKGSFQISNHPDNLYAGSHLLSQELPQGIFPRNLLPSH